ncbi:sensor histidine kinase [Inmirania thermothiophila]|uniref:C4-dicarboxylate transport sensor protein DctB n=1 Tax=Inmirania thermothiophila TaxID=1750597 RepID=A0A3N1Y7P6_9GAMM|nr:ATP-binding protein [Inmirania thermothiophila]ROR34541.1 two-component system C4-dicarboxylate transport sensor histidine kinase DctB [Inmirania thermothiophila]
MAERPLSRTLAAGIVALVVAAPVLLALVWQLAAGRGYAELREQGAQRLRLYAAVLERELGKYEPLARLLADVPVARAALSGAMAPEPASRALERFAALAGADVAYLMAPDGRTVAASNWRSADSFLGRDFGFRPYFREAMAGRPGRYYALGVASLRRGFYFSHPVRDAAGVVRGVAVVKVGTEALEALLSADGAPVAVTDPDGVVFLSSRPEWRFRTLGPLSDEAREAIRAGRRYGDAALEPLPVAAQEVVPGGVLVRLAAGGRGPSVFLRQSVRLPYAGWIVHVFSDVRPVRAFAATATLLAGVALAGLGVFAGYLDQRRARLMERIAHQQAMRETLEARVAERTAELEAANARLREEVAERRRAEAALRRTQDELVRAGKLAVLGQIAAGVTHELNQPLAAIRGYADNARVLIERGRLAEAAENLARIGELTERMAELSRHLKVFARGDDGAPPQAVSLGEAVRGALRLLAPRLRAAGVEPVLEEAAEVQVRGHEVRIGQVAVNLLANALDAVAGVAAPRIAVRVAREGGCGVLEVCDNGPGIPAGAEERIFDPFYSTKEVGEGLGLGLSISLSIAEAYGGRLLARGAPGAGACFRLELPLAQEAAA